MHNGECLTLCPINFFGNAVPVIPVCSNCITDCATCTAATIAGCTSCYNSMYWDPRPSPAATCYTTCPAPLTPKKDTEDPSGIGFQCIECDPSCALCSAPLSSTTCTKCPALKALSNGVCLDTCPDGTYDNAGFCDSCDIACTKCSTTSTTCSQC